MLFVSPKACTALELASAALFFSRVGVLYDFKSRYPHFFASVPRLQTEHIGNMFAESPLNDLALAARYAGLTWILYVCALQLINPGRFENREADSS